VLKHAKVMTPATTYSAIVGAVLVGLRELREINQGPFAKTIGSSASAWSRIENGRQALNVEQIAKASSALGVNPSDIFVAADAVADALREREVRVLLFWEEDCVAVDLRPFVEAVL
jgi:transcriptional regulator with XRE-family HTH domain